MTESRCPACLFCEELSNDVVRCSNADVAYEIDWVNTYAQLGYLEFPAPTEPPCFWFVPKEKDLLPY